MNKIIARAAVGARDLYHGVPNLMNAQVVNTLSYVDNSGHMSTDLTLKCARGQLFMITIKEAG